MRTVQLLDVEREVEELGVDIEELPSLGRLSTIVKTWRTEALHALAHTPDIKQLQHLLITGENLPVTFPGCLLELRSKLIRAEAWVERVRDALPRAKTRSNNELKKVTFRFVPRLQNLIRESRRKYATLVQVEFGTMKSLLDEASIMRINAKELDHIALVVEAAQDWVGRVREAMNAGEKATLNRLEELLIEADDIPVKMDEHQLLLCEINARRWRAKVKNFLVREATCRVDMLEKYLSDFEGIRGAMPLDPLTKKKYTLIEEIEIRSIVNTVYTWRLKVKRALNAKRGTSLTKFRALVEEAADISVLNLQAEMRPLQKILRKESEWREGYGALIATCLSSTMGPQASGGLPEACAQEIRSTISISLLEQCIVSGEKINAQIDDMHALKSLLSSGKAWLEQQEVLCPKRQTKRSSTKVAMKPSEADMIAHIDLAETMPFDFAPGVGRLQDGIESARKWRSGARHAFNDLNLKQEERSSAEGEVGATRNVFPDVDEDALELLRELSRDAETLLIRTEEEAIVERFLGIYSWGQDLYAAFGLEASKCTLTELDQLIKKGTELYGTSACEATPSTPPFMRPTIEYGASNLYPATAQLHEARNWTRAAKKVFEGSGATFKQVSELLAKASSYVDLLLRYSLLTPHVSRLMSRGG